MTSGRASPRSVWPPVLNGHWPRILLVAAVVACVLALSGGFGFGRFPLVERLAYWLGILLIGALLGRLVGAVCIPRRWFETHPVRAALIMTFVIGLPMTVVRFLKTAYAA